MDLFAALAAIASDPSAVPLWLVVAFAAGMYPVGMLFGCSACCGAVCRSCCRDDISQVVIDFALEGTGEQLIKATPWLGNYAFNYESMGFKVDPLGDLVHPYWNWANELPMFIAEGQESGAKWLFPAVANAGGVSPLLTAVYASPMGNTERTEFINGESVTITPRPPHSIVQESSLTAVVPECADATFISGRLNASFSGDRGVYEYTGDRIVNLSVSCQPDEGTVIFDVQSHDGQTPGDCDTCTPSVSRMMSHPASFLLNPCSSSSGRFSITREYSALSVSVDIMSQGSQDCQSTITAKAARSWGHLSAGCMQETTYTLQASEQDCYPFSAWPNKTTVEGPLLYDEQLVTLAASSCFGSGFNGIGTAPAGVPGVDDGPLAAVEIIDGGSGYAIKGRVEPTPGAVEIISDTGSGAELVISWAEDADACGRPVWSVASVSLRSEPGDDGGSGYTDGSPLSVVASAPVFAHSPASLNAVTGREEPSVVMDVSEGTGAELAITFTQASGPPATWAIDEITVVDGGSGYSDGATVVFHPATAADFTQGYAYGQIETEGGVIVGVTLYDAGQYYRSDGEIESVTVQDGGAYYEESDTATAIVADVEIEIQQKSPSDGTGAAVLATVDSDPASVTFGQIVGLSISGGPAYSEPTLSLSVPGGSGGSLEITGYFLHDSGGAVGYYGISGVTVASGGSGYTDKTQATVTLGAGDQKLPSSSAASITVRTALRAPSDDWTLSPNGVATGSGLVVSLTLASTGTRWAATAASVVSGGTGYTVGDLHDVDAVEGPTLFQATIEITSVGLGGVVTGIAIAYEGEFGGVDTGVIDSIQLGWRGAYRKVSQSQDGGDGYLAIHYEPGVCAGEGAPYRSCYAACAGASPTGGRACEDITGRGFLFRRGCPDYTYDITIQQRGA